MRKTEIKKAVQTISETIQTLRDNLPDLLEPYDSIDYYLEELVKAQDEAGIELDMNFCNVRETALRDVVTKTDEWNSIEEEFDTFIDDLNNWEDESNQTKAEQIRETYITQIESIKTDFDLDEVYSEDDLDDMLIGLQNRLEEFEYLQ